MIVAGTVPLSTMLSQVLVAFTIEVDNSFEQQMPHRTTMGRKAGERPSGPWLVSLSMWANFMQFVPRDGISVADLQRRGFLPDRTLQGRNPGMVRWGYVTLGPDPGDRRPKPPMRDWLVRPTEAGRRAQEIWRPLPATVETRWVERFGNESTALRGTLTALADQFDVELPDYLPENGGHADRADVALRPRAGAVSDSADLSALLAKVLLVFTLDFERQSPVSLVLGANVVRVVTAAGVPVRDLVPLTGVAKATLDVMLGSLERRGDLLVEQDGRTKVARLTPPGERAQRAYSEGVEAVEDQWCSRFGAALVADLRRELEHVVGDTVLTGSPLAEAIEPPPTGWRATVTKPKVLPHHPVVSHRGGYPDGS